jgi:2,4-dienoyl-CoA reductase-like NADH-dependent reductase (Old Yellow Enzyme family)
MPTERFIQYHEEKAKGGWGLIITEDYAVTPYAGGFRDLPGLWSDEQIAAHTAFVERIHQLGAKICCQIYHAGRQTNSKINGVQCMAPSPYKDPPSFENPKEMTEEDIHDVIRAYADAARRAKKCGFDAVEVHGAHGYLINQFNSPYSNKRCDEYGGTTWNRTRFGREVIEAVREAVGEDYPVLFKLTVNEYVAGGLSINEGREVARIYAKEPIDAITISQGVNATEWAVIPPAHISVIGFIQNVKACRDVIKDIPVIAIGVPTVVSAAAIVYDTAQALSEMLRRSAGMTDAADWIEEQSPTERYQLIRELVEPSLGQMMVTPKDIDERVAQLGHTIAEGENIALLGAEE